MSYMQVMKKRDFTLFWLTQAISQIANSFHLLALPLWVLSLTGSAFHTGFTTFLELITMMIFSPFIGVIIDNLNRKILLVISDFLRGGLVLLLLTVQSEQDIYIVYIVSVLMGLLTTVFNPTRIAAVQSIVGKEQWSHANSLLMLSFSISMILGPIVGGGAIYVLGYKITFIVNAISFFIGSIGSLLIRKTLNSSTEKKKLKDITFIKDIKTGIVAIRNLKPIQNIIVSQFFVFLGTGANSVLFILVLKNYNISSQSIGFFMATQGIGMTLSSIIFPIIKNRAKNLQVFINLCVIIMGITVSSFILLAIHNIVLGIIFILLFGIVHSFFNISVQTAIQTFSDPQIIGRIASTSQLVSRGAMALSTFVCSLASEWLNPIFLVVLGGVVLILSGIFLCIKVYIKDKQYTTETTII
ncbi:MFS transporter [Priestia megaterium]|uniref:MFS transporter n=1 Tax=Priestia megaterium TaxID=1404 RepID=UPI002FE20B17